MKNPSRKDITVYIGLFYPFTLGYRRKKHFKRGLADLRRKLKGFCGVQISFADLERKVLKMEKKGLLVSSEPNLPGPFGWLRDLVYRRQ